MLCRCRAICFQLNISATLFFYLQIGDFTVSVKASTKNRHFLVSSSNNETVFKIGQQTFSSLDELVDHYTRHPIYRSDTEKLYLVKPFRLWLLTLSITLKPKNSSIEETDGERRAGARTASLVFWTNAFSLRKCSFVTLLAYNR